MTSLCVNPQKVHDKRLRTNITIQCVSALQDSSAGVLEVRRVARTKTETSRETNGDTVNGHQSILIKTMRFIGIQRHC